MRVKYVRENESKFKERRLTQGKEYDVITRLTIIESIDGIDKEVTYVQIVDDIGNKTNYALQYGDEIWFRDSAEIRDEKIIEILKDYTSK